MVTQGERGGNVTMASSHLVDQPGLDATAMVCCPCLCCWVVGAKSGWHGPSCSPVVPPAVVLVPHL